MLYEVLTQTLLLVLSGSEEITFNNVSSAYRNSADGRKGLWSRIDLSEFVRVRINPDLSLRCFTARELLDLL